MADAPMKGRRMVASPAEAVANLERQRLGVFTCSRCGYQFWDPNPADIDAHWKEHGRESFAQGMTVDTQTADLLAALDARNVHSRGDLERYDRQGLDVERLKDAIARHQTKVRAKANGEPCVPQCARDIADEYAQTTTPGS